MSRRIGQSDNTIAKPNKGKMYQMNKSILRIVLASTALSLLACGGEAPTTEVETAKSDLVANHTYTAAGAYWYSDSILLCQYDGSGCTPGPLWQLDNSHYFFVQTTHATPPDWVAPIDSNSKTAWTCNGTPKVTAFIQYLTTGSTFWCSSPWFENGQQCFYEHNTTYADGGSCQIQSWSVSQGGFPPSNNATETAVIKFKQKSLIGGYTWMSGNVNWTNKLIY